MRLPHVPQEPHSTASTRGSRAVLRWRFVVALWRYACVVWPIVSGLVGLQLVFGVIIGRIEGWPFGEAIYFTFITGLTIGYGDLTPVHMLSRVLAVLIGIIGVLVVGVVAAVGVRALEDAVRGSR